jgi:hypothetical protein
MLSRVSAAAAASGKFKRLPKDLTTVVPKSDQTRLPAGFIEKHRDADPKFGGGAMGEMVYLRTYSRVMDWNTRKKEKWHNTIGRVVEGTLYVQQCHYKHNGLEWAPLERSLFGEELYEAFFNMKCLPPGRGLWAMGTDLIERKGLFATLFNCLYPFRAAALNDSVC